MEQTDRRVIGIVFASLILAVLACNLALYIWNTYWVAPNNRGAIHDKLDKIICYVDPEDLNCKHNVSFLLTR